MNNMKKYGYAGKILRIDLSSGSVTSESTYAYSERFLGGRGIAAGIYWNEVPPEIDAFDEQNRLILASGPLSGIPALGGSRWSVFGKSPITDPGKFCYGSLGGSFGAELKFAGYDSLVVLGKSEKLVYIFINGNSVEIRDASDIRGMKAIETRTAIKSMFGSSVKVAAIGPAGENRVPLAILLADGDASGSGGLGSVMGSKNLKAIAVHAEKRGGVPVAYPEKLHDIANEIRGFNRGNTKVWGLDFMAHGPKTKMSPCYGCMANCLRVDYKADNGMFGKFMCQSRFFYFVHALTYYQKETDVPFHANKLCDEYGIDTWRLQETLDWLIRCHQEGIVSEKDTDLQFSQLGSLEFAERLIKMISLREGFGEILSMGTERASQQLGDRAVALVKHTDPYEPRLYNINSLLFPFETRVPIQQVHEAGLTLAQWATWAKGDKNAHISTDVLKGIARVFWGSEEAADLSTLKGKALAAKNIQNRQYAKECLILCDWMYPVIDKPGGEDHIGDPAIESRILSAAMGEDIGVESLNMVGERIFNLQRAILLREGHRAFIDDMLPDEWHDEPLTKHVADPDFTVPGKGEEIISRKGATINRSEYKIMLEEYYKLRGWDEATGLQRQEQLKSLGLEDIAEELEGIKLLA